MYVYTCPWCRDMTRLQHTHHIEPFKTRHFGKAFSSDITGDGPRSRSMTIASALGGVLADLVPQIHPTVSNSQINPTTVSSAQIHPTVSNSPTPQIAAALPVTLTTDETMVNRVEAYAGDTRLVDVEPNHIGNLLRLGDPISFIPNKFLKRLRLVWIKFMQKALDTDAAIDWKKYFLLPTVLFDNIGVSAPVIKTTLASRLLLLEQDNWDSITLDSLSIRAVHRAVSDMQYESQRNKLVMKCARAGELSKAMAVALRERGMVLSPLETFSKLEAKFPQLESSITDTEFHQILNYQLPDDIQRIEVSVAVVANIVRRLKNLVKPGLDKMRNEHLKALFGTFNNSTDPEEAEFRSVYTKIINRLISGDIPQEVACLFRDIDLFAVPKGDSTDVRPIVPIAWTGKSPVLLVTKLAESLTILTSVTYSTAWKEVDWKKLFTLSEVQ